MIHCKKWENGLKKCSASPKSEARNPRFDFRGRGRPRPGSEASGVSADVRGGVFVGVCRWMFVVSVVCGVFLTL